MSDRKYKSIKHQHAVGDLHELTFACYHKMRLLTNDTWRMQLSKCLDSACEEHAMELVAFVYMPDHVHLLVFPTCIDPDIGVFLARVKQPLSSFVRGHSKSPRVHCCRSCSFASDLAGWLFASGRRVQAAIAIYFNLNRFRLQSTTSTRIL